MSNTIIYHNPRCAKSRQTLALLKDHQVDHEVIEYLKTPLNEQQLIDVIRLLQIRPFELIRKGEKLFKETFKGRELTDEEWIKVLIDHPILIERPIVVHNGKAIIGRPPENILDII